MRQYWLENYAALDAAKSSGALVDVPVDLPELGFLVRVTGRDPIAEKERDPEKKKKLLRLRVAAAGLLYHLAAEYKKRRLSETPLVEVEGEGPDHSILPDPLEVTSMVRSWEYQRRLCKTNSNACVKAQGVPPTHVTGLAFDIGRKPLSADEDALLETLLKENEDKGVLIYFKEGTLKRKRGGGQAAFHVIAHPSSLQFLAAAYASHKTNALARASVAGK